MLVTLAHSNDICLRFGVSSVRPVGECSYLMFKAAYAPAAKGTWSQEGV